MNQAESTLKINLFSLQCQILIGLNPNGCECSKMMLFHHVYCLKDNGRNVCKQNHMFYSWLCVGDIRIKIKYVEDMHRNLYQVYIMSGWSVLCGIINEDLLS
eukprot:533531_1